MPIVTRRRTLLTLATAALAACGSGDGPTTPGKIAVALSASTASVTQGTNTSVTVTVTRTNFTDAVQLSAENLPTGVTATFSPATLTGNATSSTVTLAASTGASPATTSITVRARAAGLDDATAAVSLTVAPAPAFTLTLSSATASIAQGASGTVNVTLARTNFAGPVNLTASGVPAGATATFAPASPAGDASVLTIATGTAAPGTYPIIVTGTAAGMTDRTATVTLTISGPSPAYTLAVGTLSMEQGTSATTNVTLSRTNFAGEVSLTVSGLPSGATGTFAPNPTTTSASVLTVAGGTALPGTYTVTVTGTAPGLADRTATFTLTITASSSYTITPAASTLSIAQNGSASVSIGISRSNFTGSVSLAVSGLPSGATASFSVNPVSGDASVLTINAGTAATGNYPLTITGTASGTSDRTATVTLAVTSGTAGTNVTFSFCGTVVPVWVGYQSGSAAWTRASAGANDSYSFSISGKGGVAYVESLGSNPATSGYSTTVIYGTAAELQAFGSSNCVGAPGTKIVNGSVTGLANSELAQVNLGGAYGSVLGGAPSNTFTLEKVPDGSHDLIASVTPNDLYSVSTKAIIRRALNPGTGSTLPVLDFASSEAFALNTATLTVSGLAPRKANVNVIFDTQNGSSALLTFTQTSLLSLESTQYAGVPIAQQITGDMHTVLADDPAGSVGLLAYYRSIVDRTIGMGPALSTPTVTTLATTPYARLRMQLAGQSDYDGFVTASFGQTGSSGSASTDRYANISMTAGYLGGAPTTWMIDVPDLSAASGFDVTWGLSAGKATRYYAQAFGANAFIAPADGNIVRFASYTSTSTITPTRVSAVSRGGRAAASAFPLVSQGGRRATRLSPTATQLAHVRQRLASLRGLRALRR
jgi:hypothetical protein